MQNGSALQNYTATIRGLDSIPDQTISISLQAWLGDILTGEDQEATSGDQLNAQRLLIHHLLPTYRKLVGDAVSLPWPSRLTVAVATPGE